MEVQSGAIIALTLGFLLGLKHATDADHVVAVSTIVSEYRNAWKGIWVGASWGLGHTTPLLVLGIVILLLKDVALSRYEPIAPVFEFGVGVMMVFLGLQVFWNLRRGRLHVHEHQHDAQAHLHIHGTHEASEEAVSLESHGFFKPGRPFFRAKSYLIGIIHGLAGSAAVMLVLLPQITSFAVGFGYLLLFGVGTSPLHGGHHPRSGCALRHERQVPVPQPLYSRYRRGGECPIRRRPHVGHRPRHCPRPILGTAQPAAGGAAAPPFPFRRGLA